MHPWDLRFPVSPVSLAQSGKIHKNFAGAPRGFKTALSIDHR
jgi:hypothetical protein